ncbi:hypothetical protein ACFQX7_34850 [Luedemannella flava]
MIPGFTHTFYVVTVCDLADDGWPLTARIQETPTSAVYEVRDWDGPDGGCGSDGPPTIRKFRAALEENGSPWATPPAR